MKKLINRIRTDKYYKKYKGNEPNEKDGGNLVKKYLKAYDKTGKKREDSLKVFYDEAINNNKFKELTGK